MYPKQHAGGETCLKSKRGVVGGPEGGGGKGGRIKIFRWGEWREWKTDEKCATDKQRADKEGIFRSNFHDYSTTMVSFSNSPSADTRRSPHTQITGKAPEGDRARISRQHNRDIKDPPVNRMHAAAHAKAKTMGRDVRRESLVDISFETHRNCWITLAVKRVSSQHMPLIWLLPAACRPTSCWCTEDYILRLSTW